MAKTIENPSNSIALKVARIYLRVSSDSQDLERQETIVSGAKEAGYHIGGVYREKASGARADRPELLRMIADLQPGEVVIAESIDRISRLPLEEAEKLVATIKAKGARLSIPGIVDLSDLVSASDDTGKIVLNAVQDMILKLALQAARNDYEMRRKRQAEGIELAKRDNKYAGRKADDDANASIIEHRKAGKTIAETAKLAKRSPTHVKRVWKAYLAA